MSMLITVGSRRAAELDARTVVVCYDGSQEAREALGLAARRAGSDGAVIVADVTPSLPDRDASPTGDGPASARDRHEQELRAGIAAVEIDPTHVEIERDGRPIAEALARAARLHDADEIVVGSRWLGPIHTLMATWWSHGEASAKTTRDAYDAAASELVRVTRH